MKLTAEGSSPLSRGIPQPPKRTAQQGGIIPALAGNTPKPRRTRTRGSDHPRSRGEYTPSRGPSWRVGGSSPLSRGIPGRGATRGSAEGIIPALAGNTSAPHTRHRAWWDHPRSRGEYPTGFTVAAPPRGSSPLSRGIPARQVRSRRRRRIIPALAGNTPATRGKASRTGDHPRSRGEYTHPDYLRPAVVGSSPLSRGIPQPSGLVSRVVRIIPALAGNTSLA